MTSANLVASSTGRSAGFAGRRSPEEIAEIRSVGHEAAVRHEVARTEHLGPAMSAAEYREAQDARDHVPEPLDALRGHRRVELEQTRRLDRAALGAVLTL